MKHILFLCIAALIFSCQGEDGEPGPKGDQGATGSAGVDGQDGAGIIKGGFFEGNVSGTRKDGTAFSEAFKYEYNFEAERFYLNENLGKYVFSTYREDDSREGFLSMTLEVLNRGTATETLSFLNDVYYYNYPMEFYFQKEISSNTLFRVRANAKVISTDFTHIVNPTANAIYKFAIEENGYYQVSAEYNDALLQEMRVLKTTDGKRVYFEYEYENYDGSLDYYYGNLIKVLNADGSVAANTPYNQLRLSRNGSTYVCRNLAGTDLSSTVTVPADVAQITNYNRDETTGNITFDFTMNIGVLGRTNSSGNPLTITGKYNSGGKVYSDIVSRKKG